MAACYWEKKEGTPKRNLEENSGEEVSVVGLFFLGRSCCLCT